MLSKVVQPIQVTPLRVTKPDENSPFSSTPVVDPCDAVGPLMSGVPKLGSGDRGAGGVRLSRQPVTVAIGRLPASDRPRAAPAAASRSNEMSSRRCKRPTLKAFVDLAVQWMLASYISRPVTPEILA